MPIEQRVFGKMNLRDDIAVDRIRPGRDCLIVQGVVYSDIAEL